MTTTTVELRVLVTTTDPHDDAAERIEERVRRNLHHDWSAEHLYVERVLPKR